MSNSLRPHGLYSQSMEFSKPEYWSGYPFPSPGDIPNPGIEPRSPHCRQILYQLSQKGSPRILEWVAYLCSRGSSRHRNRTRVFCIAGGFFTSWATREAHSNPWIQSKQPSPWLGPNLSEAWSWIPNWKPSLADCAVCSHLHRLLFFIPFITKWLITSHLSRNPRYH